MKHVSNYTKGSGIYISVAQPINVGTNKLLILGGYTKNAGQIKGINPA
jgi:hypothetical protein